MAKKQKIKEWQISAVLENVQNGTTKLENITNEKLRKKVEKRLTDSKRDKSFDKITLTGRVVRETEKAILFKQDHVTDRGRGVDDEVPEVWWPKSQVSVLEQALGNRDQIIVPRWLLDEKMKDEVAK